MEISTGSKMKHLKERQTSLKAFDFQFEGCFRISLLKNLDKVSSKASRVLLAHGIFHLVLKSALAQ